ncbi:DUF1593 domain-containing protein [Algoriphagus sp. H41]|uniref:DUF1593 domain-containing protein n=1 Tax=Algoriphagus oliviformis TaxID=2811231 RepID=A0ABS3C2F2_9BACT|nr:DUF1593 domain-containing protein [Algoriphagus oliviformis]MBN7810779.1 DUF1593 domain-containing protein [Algoriphagus oliviformis]
MKQLPKIAFLLTALLLLGFYEGKAQKKKSEKTRVLVTSDGEIDDQCSIVRFLFYVNEWDVEGIITSSSQYHAHDHNWPGDDWIDPYLDAYAKDYPNLVKHDPDYPTPAFLRERTLLGNVKTEGEMTEITPGSELIVKVLLDETDDRPIWIQAWGGTNTLARALKSIEESHPEKMEYVAEKMRLYLIWEQDATYQEYIRPHWGKYNIPTIISDQFEAIAYRWAKVQPKTMQPYFEGPWMKANILENHGALASLYPAMDNGDFRSEGDSPAFLHTIPTGLRSLESPNYGGWGGRFVKIRENTWLDSVPVSGYEYPEGRWYGSNGWGRASLREGTNTTAEERNTYFKPMWRWSDAMQNDFAARADWSVKSYADANHPPVVRTKSKLNPTAKPGEIIKLSVAGSKDPDGDQLSYDWYVHTEPSTLPNAGELVKLTNSDQAQASFVVPQGSGTIHIICAVTDNGSPALTRYSRVIVSVKAN